MGKTPEEIDKENKAIIEKEFLNPPLSVENMDRYIVRKAILQAVLVAKEKFYGELLDVGCGIMPYRSTLLAEPTKIERYIGLDLPSDTYVANVDLRWDGKRIPLEDHTVDGIMATEVLEHCPKPVETLRECLRVLRPGGILFFTVPFLWPLHDVPHDYQRFTSFGLKALLKESGFTQIDIQPLGGWNASFAQILGLWAKRAPAPEEIKRNRQEQFFELYKSLIEGDQPLAPYSPDCMATGWFGFAKKPT